MEPALGSTWVGYYAYYPTTLCSPPLARIAFMRGCSISRVKSGNAGVLCVPLACDNIPAPCAGAFRALRFRLFCGRMAAIPAFPASQARPANRDHTRIMSKLYCRAALKLDILVKHARPQACMDPATPLS